MLDPGLELCDLHIHVGGAVAPHILWSIAHEQGFKLPVSTYWEFRDLVTAKPETVSSLDEYLAILHHWTEKIQSSPAAIERSVYEIIGKEFRSSGVSLIELRFNPMKRNLGGERDLDHIIHAALRGMDRACLEYGVRAGLIFCLAREFSLELNEILVKKAVKYKARGVVGIDLAGPESHTLELGDQVSGYRDLFASPVFPTYKPEDQRKALQLMILNKNAPRKPTETMIDAHRAAVPALTELVS